MRMKVFRAAVACAVALVCVVPGRVRAQGPYAADDADRDAINAVIQKLFDGMRLKDSVAMAEVFAPRAQLTGWKVRPDGTPFLQYLTGEQFINFAMRDNRGAWIERAYSPEFRVDGNLATVWAFYDFQIGDKFSHCGTDAILLLREDGKWRITSIADTYYPDGAAGCDARRKTWR